MSYLTPSAFLGSTLVGMLVGRYAIAHNEPPGTLFYAAAPLAFATAIVMLVLALRAFDVRGKAVAAVVVSALAFVFGWKPGTTDGEHSVLFFAAGLVLAVYAFVHVRRWNGTAAAGADRTAARAAGVGAIVVMTAAAAVVAFGVFLLLFFWQYDSSS